MVRKASPLSLPPTLTIPSAVLLRSQFKRDIYLLKCHLTGLDKRAGIFVVCFVLKGNKALFRKKKKPLYFSKMCLDRLQQNQSTV